MLWTIGAAGSVLLITLASLVALMMSAASSAAIAAAALAGAGSTVVAARWARAAYVRWRWSAGARALELRHGVVIAHHSVIPYHRLQQIDIVRGPLERVLGLATLTLRTAAATTDAQIPGIDAAAADALRRLLLERAGHDDAV